MEILQKVKRTARHKKTHVRRATQANIETLQESLQRERRVRERKEEYESLAKIINSVKPKAQSRAEIEVLKAEVAALEDKANAVEREYERKGAQFELLLQTIDDLQRSYLEEEQDQEDMKAREAAAVEDKANDNDDPMNVEDDGEIPEPPPVKSRKVPTHD